MKKFLLLFALVPSLAFAADLPGKALSYAPVAWTGFYAGVNAGLGYTADDQSIAGADKFGALAVSSGFVPASIATRGGGPLAGGQIGYDYQINNFVIGPEFDIDYAHVGKSGGELVALGPFALATNADTRLNWLGTLRARAGYLVTPSLLVYATGGGAFGGIDNTTSIALSGPKGFNVSAASDGSTTKWGWTVGAGVEYQFANRWSVKGEYRYVDLGSIDTALGAAVLKTPVSFTTSQTLRYQTLLVGLNYRFSGL